MTHTITVRLSPAAQRAAILSGENAAEWQTYDVTRPEDLAGLATLFDVLMFPVNPNGYTNTLQIWAFGGRLLGRALAQRPASAAEAIAAVRAELAAVDAERLAACGSDHGGTPLPQQSRSVFIIEAYLRDKWENLIDACDASAAGGAVTLDEKRKAFPWLTLRLAEYRRVETEAK